MNISTCLWFESQAEEAAQLYVSLFDDAEIRRIQRHSDGRAFFVELTLLGQRYMALNGGPRYTLSPAASIFVSCETQAEIDRLWTALLEGGGSEMKCGWLCDRFGLSWQIIPRQLSALLGDPDPARAERAMKAMLSMVKIDLAALEAAHRGD